MKFKVGDKVRVKDLSEIDNDKHPGINKYMYHYSGKEAVITNVHSDFYEINIDKDRWSWSYEMLEYINDYITTKDFIKEVEKLGYDVEIEQGIEINVTDGHFEISIYIEESDYLNIEYFGNVKNISPLLKLIIKYLETPIEFREEPKKYTLELPNTTIKARYFRFGLPHAKHSYKFGALPKSTTNGDIDYQTYFTQQEIDNLPNQELIKCLIEKEVEYD